MAKPTYSVKVGWGNAVAGALVFDFSRFTDDDGLLPEGGTGDVFSSSFLQFFTGPDDDITADVEALRISRGRDTLLDNMSAGTLEIIARRPDDKPYWNPANPDSDINTNNAPGFQPMRPVSVVATYDDGGGPVDYPMFYGFIRSARYDPQTGECSIQAVDLFLWLSRMFAVFASDIEDGDREAADVTTATASATSTLTGSSSRGLVVL
jgi:hypothetical protein